MAINQTELRLAKIKGRELTAYCESFGTEMGYTKPFCRQYRTESRQDIFRRIAEKKGLEHFFKWIEVYQLPKTTLKLICKKFTLNDLPYWYYRSSTKLNLVELLLEWMTLDEILEESNLT